MIENVSDLQNPIVLKEVGSGLNDKRKELQRLLKIVGVRNVYVHAALNKVTDGANGIKGEKQS